MNEMDMSKLVITKAAHEDEDQYAAGNKQAHVELAARIKREARSRRDDQAPSEPWATASSSTTYRSMIKGCASSSPSCRTGVREGGGPDLRARQQHLKEARETIGRFGDPVGVC